MLLSQAKEDGIVPTLTMYRCIIGKFIEFNCLHMFFYHKKLHVFFVLQFPSCYILSADPLFTNNNVFFFQMDFSGLKKEKKKGIERTHIFQLIMNFNFFCL